MLSLTKGRYLFFVFLFWLTFAIAKETTTKYTVIGHPPVISDVKFNYHSLPEVGEIVTVSAKATDSDGDVISSFLYQWKVDGVDVTDQYDPNSKNLTIMNEYVGKKISVEITALTDKNITDPYASAVMESPDFVAQNTSEILGSTTLTGIFHDRYTPYTTGFLGASTSINIRGHDAIDYNWSVDKPGVVSISSDGEIHMLGPLQDSVRIKGESKLSPPNTVVINYGIGASIGNNRWFTPLNQKLTLVDAIAACDNMGHQTLPSRSDVDKNVTGSLLNEWGDVTKYPQSGMLPNVDYWLSDEAFSGHNYTFIPDKNAFLHGDNDPKSGDKHYVMCVRRL